MNTSAKTTDIAKGIYLWSVLQNLPMSIATNPRRKENKAWREWQSKHNDIEIRLVQDEQYRLFDVVNNL